MTIKSRLNGQFALVIYGTLTKINWSGSFLFPSAQCLVLVCLVVYGSFVCFVQSSLKGCNPYVVVSTLRFLLYVLVLLYIPYFLI